MSTVPHLASDEDTNHRVWRFFGAAFALAVAAGWMALQSAELPSTPRPLPSAALPYDDAVPLTTSVRPKRGSDPHRYKLVVEQETGELLVRVAWVASDRPQESSIARVITDPSVGIWVESDERAHGLTADIERLLEGTESSIELAASGRQRESATLSSQSPQLEQLLGFLSSARALIEPRFPVGEDLNTNDQWAYAFGGIEVSGEIVGLRGSALIVASKYSNGATGSGVAIWDLEHGYVREAQIALEMETDSLVRISLSVE